jgi:3-keto-5-aminohexanoate cleavage enzyme
MSQGVGLTVTLRVRMGAHDAHYAGELVDGARMLALFGDVATELLIRLDGDEGLFRAYEMVEFLAPVLAGDYIEATGVITRVGASSRAMAFEARKVVQSCRRPDLPASAADALAEPIVVCRAVGTCVVPKVLQREPRLVLPSLSAMAPEHAVLPEPRPIITPAPQVIVTPPPSHVILTAAIVGAEVTRKQTPHLPITAEEIADEAARCRDAGAAVIHLHVRTPDGRPSQSSELFAAAIDAIRRKTDVIVQTSTGGAVGMSVDERSGPLGCKPEMATLNCGTINFGNDVFVNTRGRDPRLARAHQRAGSACRSARSTRSATSTRRSRSTRRTSSRRRSTCSSSSASPARWARAGVDAAFPRLGARGAGVPHTWGVAAVGRFQRPMTELAVRMGGHARVGLEDNVYLEKGVLSEGSAPLVERAADFARSVGREPATPERARQMLGLVASTSAGAASS